MTTACGNQSIGILVTSRNNYEFMEKFWIPRTLEQCDRGKYKVLNIDEDSSEAERKKGILVCNKNNIQFMDREKKGMHNNVDTAIRFFGSDIKYIVWFQHDCWPLQKDFFHQFNRIVSSGKLDQFGTVGFNGIAQNMFKRNGEHDEILHSFLSGNKPLGVLARSNLESAGVGDVYYCGRKVKNRIKYPVPEKLFSQPFACAVPIWYAIAVNTGLFRKHIDPDRKFYFFKSWDDIAFQFLLKNVYNLVLPDMYVEHRPDLKRKIGMPQLSNKPVKKGNETFHQAVGYDPKYWQTQWGWDFEQPKTFEEVKDKYKGTLLREFYKFDYRKGPFKIFNV